MTRSIPLSQGKVALVDEADCVLTLEDCAFILESLRYTELAFADYEFYPSYDFKRKRIAECRAVRDKVRSLRDQLRGQEKLP